MTLRSSCLLIIALTGLSGAVLLAKSVYIPIKATLAQTLIKTSYLSAQGHGQHPPWPWADTHPVARLSFSDRELFVLEGTNLRNLAFGPTRVDSSSMLDSSGTKVIVGHRDTHFASLAELRIGHTISLETPKGLTRTYVIDDIVVLKRDGSRLPLERDNDMLYLVTCYPFNAVDSNPDYRYIVRARRAQMI